jgi:hypothetical protein
MPEVPRFAMYSGCVLDQLSGRCSGRAADRDRPAGRPRRNHRRRHGRGHAHRAGPAALRPFQRHGEAQRHGAGQRRLGRDHLFQRPRPDRDHPRRRPHRGRRPRHGRADRPDRGAVRRQRAGHPGHRRHALRAGVRLQPRRQRQLHLHRPCRLPARARGSRSRARRASRPPSTGRPPRPPAPPACAPPSSSTPLQDTDHDPTEPVEPPEWLDLPPACACWWPPDHRADGLRPRRSGHRSLPEGASQEDMALAMAKAVARRAVLDWEGVGDDAATSSPSARPGSTPCWKSGRSSRPSRRNMSPRPDAGRGKKRLRALADWSFGGGDGYCAACAGPCPDCPARLNRPQTVEGWQVWDLVSALAANCA